MKNEISKCVKTGLPAVRKPKQSDFFKLRRKMGLSDAKCLEVLGIDLDTLQLWDLGENAPSLALRFLKLYDRQDLSGHGEEWKGFRFSRGRLVCGRQIFSGQNLKKFPLYVEVYNRAKDASMRYSIDGLPLDEALKIVFSSKSFVELSSGSFVPDSGF